MLAAHAGDEGVGLHVEHAHGEVVASEGNRGGPCALAAAGEGVDVVDNAMAIAGHFAKGWRGVEGPVEWSDGVFAAVGARGEEVGSASQSGDGGWIVIMSGEASEICYDCFFKTKRIRSVDF